MPPIKTVIYLDVLLLTNFALTLLFLLAAASSKSSALIRNYPLLLALNGTVAAVLERRMYAPSKLRGAAYTAILVGGAAALGYAARNVPGATAVGTWAVVGGAGLRKERAPRLRGGRKSNGPRGGQNAQKSRREAALPSCVDT